MYVETFFNRPSRPFDRSLLINEMKSATHYLAIASAWFTDMELAEVVVNSKARLRTIILSRADLNRPGSKELYEYVLRHHKTFKVDDDEGEEVDAGLHVAVLGNGDFHEGVMHHKFVIVDDESVWTGSFNHTYQARRNYENVVRIQSSKIARAYQFEVQELLRDEALWMGSSQFAFGAGAFRCAACNKIKPMGELGEDGSSWGRCAECVKSGKNW